MRCKEGKPQICLLQGGKLGIFKGKQKKSLQLCLLVSLTLWLPVSHETQKLWVVCLHEISIVVCHVLNVWYSICLLQEF